MSKPQQKPDNAPEHKQDKKTPQTREEYIRALQERLDPKKNYEEALRADFAFILDGVAPGKGDALADQLLENLVGFMMFGGHAQASAE